MADARGHVLMTGGGSFVGALIGPRLLAAGWRVSTIVRGRPAAWAEDAAGASTIQADLAAPGLAARLPARIDAVVHVAGRVEDAAAPEAAFQRDNVAATAALAAWAVSAGARRFVFCSSISVHGTVNVARIDETTGSEDPTPYGRSKRDCESLLAALAGLPSISLRLPGVVGPGAHGNWLCRLADALRRGDPVNVSNPDFAFDNTLHADDLAGFVGDLLDRDWAGAHAFPIAAGVPMRVADMVALMRDLTGSASPVTVVPGRAPFSIDSGYAAARFGYRPAAVRDIVTRFLAA
jgi:nucleoside-diphosphate-sugar epimerase